MVRTRAKKGKKASKKVRSVAKRGKSKSKRGAKARAGAKRAKTARPTTRRKVTSRREDNYDPCCDFDSVQPSLAAGARAVAAAPLAASAPPKAVPTNDPVPFAQSTAAPQARHWPVDTNNSSGRVVSYETAGGQIQGAPGRRFLAQRNSGGRFHVGIDLFANQGDTVVACEDGKIVAFYEFYPSSAGEMTYALLVEHADFVANYGEVTQNSPTVFDWSVGDSVTAGQPIARVSSTRMTHFETYRRGTRRNQRWHPGDPRPAALLNPTAYLLGLAAA